MLPFPPDPRDPQLEIVPVEPVVTEREVEDQFWENHAEVPITEIFKKGVQPPKGKPS